jgi:nucleoid-associated protein YgaU
MEYIENSTEQSLYYRIANKLAAADRLPGPKGLHEVSMSARRRWLEDPKNLRDGVKYRPATLNRVQVELDHLNPADFGLGEVADSNAQYTMYQVKRGDSLRAIAKELLGSANEADRIFKANLNKLDSADRIYPGQMLRIPPVAGPSAVDHS